MKYTDIATYLAETAQLNVDMGRSDMDWGDELMKKLSIPMRERMVSKYCEKNAVQWRNKLRTIGNDEEQFLETE